MNEEYAEMFEQLVEEIESGCATIIEMSIEDPMKEITSFGDDVRVWASRPKVLTVTIVGTPKHEDDLLA